MSKSIFILYFCIKINKVNKIIINNKNNIIVG